MKKVLVTGGTGYIGSHTVVELLNSGYEVVIVDNFSNSHPEVLNRIENITGQKPTFYEVDVIDRDALENVFKQHNFDGVIHFAGYKAVGESVEQPIKYYHNNIGSTFVLCDLMETYNVYQLVFSSSATVYGMNNMSPLTEDLPLSATNPYGRSKLMIESILTDLCKSNDKWSVALLRYFNPIGAHSSGLIGESPNGIPNNLMPYITQVAIGKRDCLSVFGDDYDTPDGTGVRDYIHVVDLAIGHVKALTYVDKHRGSEAINLGTGVGYSVLDLVHNFVHINKIEVPYTIVDRRSGDIGTCYSDASKAKSLLEWSASKGIEDMCRDSWQWQQKNPKGFDV